MPGPNLLTDTEATFETGLSISWQVPAGTVADEVIARTTSVPHTGTQAMRLSTAAGDSSAVQGLLQRDITVTAGTSYTFTVWAKPVNRDMVPFIRVTTFNGPGGFGVATSVDTFSATSAGTITAGTWVAITKTFTPTGAAAAARILVSGASGGSSLPGDTVDFDDMFFGLENAPPLTLTATLGMTGLTAQVDATITSLGDGAPFTYTIDYDDGVTDSFTTSSTTHTFTHTYLDTTSKTIKVQAYDIFSVSSNIVLLYPIWVTGSATFGSNRIGFRSPSNRRTL